VLIEGVVHAPQHPETLAAIGRAVEPYDALPLAALHTATTLTGSAIIPLALARGRLALAEAWAVAHVDEDWQMSQWGIDEIAMARRAARFREMEAAALVLGA
jgi:chaperone required for assembly of F1-ATPase